MTRRFFWIVVPLALAGCVPADEQSAEDPAADGEVSAEPAGPEATATAEADTGGARQVAEVTDLFVFEYSYPQAAGEDPRLSQWLDRRLENERGDLAEVAARGRREARDNGFPFNKYSSSTEWEVVADLPGWLSLSAELSSYQGGAHPNYGFDTVVWDEERERPMEPIDFFNSPQALGEVLGDRLCEQLNEERERRRGEPVDPEQDDSFSACVAIEETNVLLGSRGGRKFDRIGIQIAPYVAGPYAEGAYELIFEVTPELLETVKPEYRDDFAARN